MREREIKSARGVEIESESESETERKRRGKERARARESKFKREDNMGWLQLVGSIIGLLCRISSLL